MVIRNLLAVHDPSSRKCLQGYGNQAGTKAHNHSSDPGAVTAAKIVKLVKEKALEDKFKLASAMVGEVFILHLTDLQVNLANWRLHKNNV